MKALQEKTNGMVLIFGEILIGIILFMKPVGFTTGIITILGILLVIAGVAQLISWFRSSPTEGTANGSLSKGLLEIIGGLFCVLNQDWFIATFPALTILYGIGMLVSGVTKVETAMNMLRLKMQPWKWNAISAAVTLICAVIILSNPFSTTIVLWKFVAVSLIIEAVFDILAKFLPKKSSAE